MRAGTAKPQNTKNVPKRADTEDGANADIRATASTKPRAAIVAKALPGHHTPHQGNLLSCSNETRRLRKDFHLLSLSLSLSRSRSLFLTLSFLSLRFKHFVRLSLEGLFLTDAGTAQQGTKKTQRKRKKKKRKQETPRHPSEVKTSHLHEATAARQGQLSDHLGPPPHSSLTADRRSFDSRAANQKQHPVPNADPGERTTLPPCAFS